ncbi:MAG: hypothetical protein WCD02_10460 [Terriglobales bacterium]
MALPDWLPETFEEAGKNCKCVAEHFRNKCDLEPKPNDLSLLKYVADIEDEKGQFLLEASKSRDEAVWEKACRVLTDGISALR